MSEIMEPAESLSNEENKNFTNCKGSDTEKSIDIFNFDNEDEVSLQTESENKEENHFEDEMSIIEDEVNESRDFINKDTLLDIVRTHHLGKVYNSYTGEKQITNIRYELKQIPDNTNGHSAIVRSTVTTTGGEFQGIGVAKLDSNDDQNANITQYLIDSALYLATQQAMSLASFTEGGVAVVSDPEKEEWFSIEPKGGKIIDVYANKTLTISEKN